jgi:hypothetical protein
VHPASLMSRGGERLINGLPEAEELCWNLGDEAIRRRGLPARQ